MDQEDTIAQLRQATHAHQTQNAYLASEVNPPPRHHTVSSYCESLFAKLNYQIKKLEREHGIELASRDEQISVLRAQLEEQKSGPDHYHDTLQAEFAALQKLYASKQACIFFLINLILAKNAGISPRSL